VSKPTEKTKAPPRKRARKQTSARDSVEVKAALQSQSGIRRRPTTAMLPETMVVPGRGREGLKGVVIYLNEAAKTQLSKLAIDERKTVQELGVEAINLLFRSHRQKPIA
jgi:hypothetical protein